MKRFLILLIGFTLLLCVATGCSSDVAVDWNMTAFLVKEDGTVTKTFSIAVSGTIEKEESASYLKLDIELPKDFRYSFARAGKNGNICAGRAYHSGDFVTNGYTYDKVANAPAAASWAVNTEKEYFIAYWGEDFGRYLVAATDPDITPEEIMEHFEKFGEEYLFG